MARNVNLGGDKLKLETIGVSEGLEKVNLLLAKLEEAKSLIDEIASMEIDIRLSKVENDEFND